MVQSGESLSTIAQHYYGKSSKFAAILRANPEVRDENRLRIGDKLVIPDLRAAVPAKQSKARTPPKPSRPAAPATHTVRKGDSLYDIAARRLGKGGSWRDLYKWNRGVIGPDPGRLKIGMVLRLTPPPPPAARGRRS